MIPRSLLIVPLICVIALGGCRMRGEGAGGDEDTTGTTSDNSSAAMQAQINSLTAENEKLQTSLDAALKNVNSGPTLGSTGIAGGDVEGFESTGTGGLAFAKGSADLNEEGKKAIGRLAERLNQGDNAGKKITIKGYTDDTPVSRASTKEKYVDNWGLSAARAASVVRALEKAGIESERLTGAFRGSLDPRSKDSEDKAETSESAEKSEKPKSGKASKHDTSDQARNRRVEIYLAG